MGNQSPVESPLMDVIRRWVAPSSPDARVVPAILQGFSDSRTFRHAFPDLVAYGFFPRRAMTLYEAAPLIHSANERIPVVDLGTAADFFKYAAERDLWLTSPSPRRHGAAQRPARARADALGRRGPRRRRVDRRRVGPQAARRAGSPTACPARAA